MIHAICHIHGKSHSNACNMFIVFIVSQNMHDIHLVDLITSVNLGLLRACLMVVGSPCPIRLVLFSLVS